jgi:sugar lactone lactonase YvrE
VVGSRAGRIPLALVVTLASSAVAASAASAPASSRVSTFSSWLVAGNGSDCASPPACGDGPAATSAQLGFPTGVAVGPHGDLYVADWGDNEIRKIGLDGSIAIVAGGGTACSVPPSCGDGAAATDAQLSFPSGVAVDKAGNVYIADTEDNEVRKVSATGTIIRFAGTGKSCARPPACGDGGQARSAQLSSPGGVAVNSAGDVYIADSADDEIRVVTPDGKITRVAGTGTACSAAPSCGDGGAATSAQLFRPEGVTVSRAGEVLIADDGDNEVRLIGADGRISRLAGSGTACSAAPSCGDGGSATAAKLNLPDGVAVDGAGNVYIADDGDNEVREVTGGKILRIAGTGATCSAPPSCGDGGPATSARFNYPDAVGADASGNVYVTDTYDSEVRLLTQSPVEHVVGTTTAVSTFSTAVTSQSVIVRFVLSGPATVTLSVRASRSPAQVARVSGKPGWGELIWSRKLGGRAAPRGRYNLDVTATSGTGSATRSLSVRL